MIVEIINDSKIALSRSDLFGIAYFLIECKNDTDWESDRNNFSVIDY